MSWTARQRAMLDAMGLRLWPAPPVALALATEDTAVAAVGVEETRATWPPPVAAAQGPSQRSVAEPAPAAPLRMPATVPQPVAAPAAAVQSPAGITFTARGLRPDVGRLDWAALREHVAGCRACGLCESRTQTVFGVGHPRAHWMVVGEAPGEQEDRAGEPFVGPAGQLLDRMLAALQLTRAEDGDDSDRPPSQRVYIANTLKCRPPRNRNPAPDEMAQCEPYLQRQIELLQPRIILAMGAFAVKALLRSELPVGKLRGQVHRYHGVPLVVTYHPAYLLRSLQEKAKAWDDLCLAAQVVEEAQRASADA